MAHLVSVNLKIDLGAMPQADVFNLALGTTRLLSDAQLVAIISCCTERLQDAQQFPGGRKILAAALDLTIDKATADAWSDVMDEKLKAGAYGEESQ